MTSNSAPPDALDELAVAYGLPPGTLEFFASPGLAADPSRPDLGIVATLIFSVMIRPPKNYAGIPPAELVAHTYRTAGFQTFDQLDLNTLLALPVLQDWNITVDRRHPHLTIKGPDHSGTFTAQLSNTYVRRWSEALDRRKLTVTLATCTDLVPDLGDLASLATACRTGALVGAQIPTNCSHG
jgi:hypothetical protein